MKFKRIIYNKKGSIPLVLIILIVMITMSSSLLSYMGNEMNFNKSSKDYIQAKYSSEAGVEIFLYELKKMLGKKEITLAPIDSNYDTITDYYILPTSENIVTNNNKHKLEDLIEKFNSSSIVLEKYKGFQVNMLSLTNDGVNPITNFSNNSILPYNTDFQIEFEIILPERKKIKIKAKFNDIKVVEKIGYPNIGVIDTKDMKIKIIEWSYLN